MLGVLLSICWFSLLITRKIAEIIYQLKRGMIAVNIHYMTAIMHWKKQCVPHYVKIVLTLWRNSGIILELSLPQFCYNSRVLPQCGIIS